MRCLLDRMIFASLGVLVGAGSAIEIKEYNIQQNWHCTEYALEGEQPREEVCVKYERKP